MPEIKAGDQVTLNRGGVLRMRSTFRNASLWILLATLGLIAAAAPSEQHTQGAYAADENPKGASNQPNTIERSSPPAEIERVRDPVYAQGSKYRSTREAGAYDQNPDHARLTLWFSGAQAVASVIGVIGLFATVLYARAAWKEARRSADAAHSSTRPWVLFEARIVSVKNVGDDGIFINYSVTAKNYGASPAVGVLLDVNTYFSASVYSSALIFDPDLELSTSTEKYKIARSKAESKKGDIIASGSELVRTFGSIIDIKDQWRDSPNGKILTPLVCISAVYRDPTWKLDRYVQTGTISVVAILAPDGNTMGIRPDHLEVPISNAVLLSLGSLSRVE